MKRLLIISLITLIPIISFGQDRKTAEKAVIGHMSVNSSFKVIRFGECFEQNYPEDIQQKLKTSSKVKYSLVLSYVLDDVKTENEYFHLDNKYNVIGHLSMNEMMGVTIDLLENNKEFQNQLDTVGIIKN